MKKRILSLAIALLLVCGMPVSAFAIGNNPAGTTVQDISALDKMETNYGTVEVNDGTVEFNIGTVNNNFGTVDTNYGTVGETDESGNVVDGTGNFETVNTNFGTVTANEKGGIVVINGTAIDNASAVVGTNNGSVMENWGTVGINNSIVDTNSSTGTVGTNNKTVEKNYGEVTTNENGGTVVKNGSDTDNAKVGTNNGEVSSNSGTVGTNNSIVDINSDRAVVEINADKGTVNTNSGTVGTNNGTVHNNSRFGTVETNNGTMDINNGTVDINNGTVDRNEGSVATNNITGTVTNFSGGKVGTNYGTVIDRKDNNKTTYGVQVDGALFQKNEGEDFDLTQFTKAGYELTGYTQAYRMTDDRLIQETSTVNSTNYISTCPNILTLIWRALTGQGESAGYFGPGCYISVNGKQYILVEVKDGSYYLASCDEYTKEQLSDPDALLASLLTEEQLDCVTGAAEVLNAELTDTFFGGGSHIVFPCSKYLIFS